MRDRCAQLPRACFSRLFLRQAVCGNCRGLPMRSNELVFTPLGDAAFFPMESALLVKICIAQLEILLHTPHHFSLRTLSAQLEIGASSGRRMRSSKRGGGTPETSQLSPSVPSQPQGHLLRCAWTSNQGIKWPSNQGDGGPKRGIHQRVAPVGCFGPMVGNVFGEPRL